jgi:hypothetical protein
MNVTRLESETTTRRPAVPAEKKGGMRLSMHDGVAVWCDCCSCEAEPYWVAVAEELGIDLSDNEGAHTEPAPKSGKRSGR